jgi:hypothetical protein
MLRENIGNAVRIERLIGEKKEALASVEQAPNNELGFAVYTKPGFNGNVTLARTVFEDERTIADVKRALVAGLEWELKELESQLEAIL